MATFVYDKATDRMVNKATGEPMVSGPFKPVTPMVFGDFKGYESPIDGSWIEGRRARKYDMEKNNCIDANELHPPMTKLKNKRFAEKHNMQHLLD